MRIKKAVIALIIMLLFAVIAVDLAFSQYDDEMLKKMEADEELQQEFKWLKAETFVITASKVMETLKKAPASITVITDRQIRQMGASNLVDVLRAVPGFNAYKMFNGIFNITVRGRSSLNNVLLMINSHPINDALTGGATSIHDTLIIDNIKRIEFIRGPGSALYGANAFVGVINVITKKAEDIDGFEFKALGGSWDTQQYNLLFGKNFSDLEVTFNFNYFKTHGFRAFIEEDFQTSIDQQIPDLIAPDASLAPGRTNGGDEKYDVALNLKYEGFTFDGRYVDRERDYPIGDSHAMNEKSISSSEDYYLNLSYVTAILEGLDLSGKVYRNHLDITNDYQELPPGVALLTPTGLGIWEEGLLVGNSLNATRTGIEIQATYTISDSNTVVAGATYEEQKVDNTVWANFRTVPGTDPPQTRQLPSMQEWPDHFAAGRGKRNFKAFFLEDIWDLTDDIRLTTGVRYDRYSDFDSKVSPRVGLTWEYIKGYDLKLLYGHAFRAPTFIEIVNSDPGSELDAETIDTYEASLGADFTSSLSSRGTFYYRVREDAIDVTSTAAPWYFVNASEKIRDHGFEIEAKYDFGRGTYLAGNYNYQSFNRWARIHVGKVMSNIRLSRYLNFYADCQFYDGRERLQWLPGEDRDDPSGYAIVNATMIAKKFLKSYKGLELRGSVYNMLDKDYKSPQGPKLPHDLPMPGINCLLEIKYTF